MAHTAIGIFREQTQAEAAVHKLMDNGFRRDKMDIALPDPNESRGDTTDENSTLNSKIGRFFIDVFQGDSNTALKYAAVAQRGVVIAVQGEFYADARKAAAIMDECGAVDVEREGRVLDDAMTRSDRTLQSQQRHDEIKQDLEASADAADVRQRSAEHHERVNTGEYAIHTRIVDRPVGGGFRVREEETRIERNEGATGGTVPSDDTTTRNV